MRGPAADLTALKVHYRTTVHITTVVLYMKQLGEQGRAVLFAG